MGSDRVIQIWYAGTTCTSVTVLFASARILQVWYPGTTYASLTVIGVSSDHTGIVRCHDVYIVDCVFCVSSGHTSIICWHDVHRWLCYLGKLGSHRYYAVAQRIHRRLSCWGQLGSYRYHMLARHISSTVLLVSVHVIQVSYAGTTYIVDCVIGVSSGHTGIICWHDVHRWLFYWGQLGSYGYYTLAWRTSSTVLLGSARDIQVWYPGTTYTSLTVIEVSSGDTCIIRWHDVHCWLCYWGQLRSYMYHTLARRTSLTVLLGSAQVIQVSYAG